MGHLRSFSLAGLSDVKMICDDDSVLAPVLSAILFARGGKEWHNPIMDWITARYRGAATWAIGHRDITVGGAVFALGLTGLLAFSGAIGSEFLPHLDEGAIWVRGPVYPARARVRVSR